MVCALMPPPEASCTCLPKISRSGSATVTKKPSKKAMPATFRRVLEVATSTAM